MNAAESKYAHTAARMDDAFLELLGEKDFPFITVKEICRRAGVNRSTFYLHYETINDLLLESIERMNHEFFAQLRNDLGEESVDPTADSLEDLKFITPKYLTPYLAYIRENKRLFRTALKQHATLQAETTYSNLFAEVFNPVLARHNVPCKDRPYLVQFYVKGIMAIVTLWLENDCEEDIEHIVELINMCAK